MHMKKLKNKKFQYVAVVALIVLAGAIGYWQYQTHKTIPDHFPVVNQDIQQTKTSDEKMTTIVAVGDISCSTESGDYADGAGNDTGCHMANTAALARSLKPEVLLLLGDLQYETGSKKQFDESYSKTWGADDLKKIPRPVPGNHEYITKGAGAYYDYFGQIAGDRYKGYYSFDINNWHVVALNSNCVAVACGSGSEQTKWLQKDLQDNKSKCSIAYFHHPLFSSATHGKNDFMKPIYDVLLSNKVDITLAGHDHVYERFGLQDSNAKAAPEGIRSFIVGTGGKNHYPFRIEQPNSEVRISQYFGVLKLELGKESYKWQFISEDNRVLDQGFENCR